MLVSGATLVVRTDFGRRRWAREEAKKKSSRRRAHSTASAPPFAQENATRRISSENVTKK